MYYYDPIYGKIELPQLVWDLIDSCPEVKRLKDLGFTNFSTLAMHPLSKVSRLEHAIGVTHLTNIFTEKLLLSEIQRNNLLTAALFHDIGAAPFGHTVEWTLNRYANFDHERNVKWVLKGDELGYDRQLVQMYYEPNLFYERFVTHKKAQQQYHLDPDLILSYLDGKDLGKMISSSGLDLDNIDNVFRMNFYVGNSYDKGPVALVRCLNWHQDNFTISRKDSHLIFDWLKARYYIYNLFIYAAEYISYEYMLSRAVEGYFKELIAGNSNRIEPSHWVLTDSQLIQGMYNAVSTKDLAKRILLLDLYDVIEIFISDKVDLHPKLTNLNEREKIERGLESALQNHFNKPKVPFPICVHCTTDFRKRFRQIVINVVEENGNVCQESFGNNRNNLVIGVLTPLKFHTYDKNVKAEWNSIITDYLMKILDTNIMQAEKRITMDFEKYASKF